LIKSIGQIDLINGQIEVLTGSDNPETDKSGRAIYTEYDCTINIYDGNYISYANSDSEFLNTVDVRNGNLNIYGGTFDSKKLFFKDVNAYSVYIGSNAEAILSNYHEQYSTKSLSINSDYCAVYNDGVLNIVQANINGNETGLYNNAECTIIQGLITISVSGRCIKNNGNMTINGIVISFLTVTEII
jgi:hypothetical protein